MGWLDDIFTEYKEDINILIRFTVRNVAKNIKIKHTDFMSTEELLIEIGEKDKQTFDILEKYLEAYDKYIKVDNFFHSRFNENGQSTNSKEATELDKAKELRDAERKALIERINNITN